MSIISRDAKIAEIIMLSKAHQIQADCSLNAWTGEEGRCHWCNEALPVGGRRKTWCSKKCNRAFEINHVWNIARATARRRYKYFCSVPGCSAERRNIEINHINPLVGAGYGVSCFHHQDNLEALCPEHHQMVTNQQRAERKRAKDAVSKEV